MSSASALRVVDLFSGCGGLSLGFEHCAPIKGAPPYEVVLGIDNWKPAVDVFCANHRSRISSAIRVGRVADLSWFNHASEALLFYLAHYAAVASDTRLTKELRNLKFPSFIASLAKLDREFQQALSDLAQTAAHQSVVGEIDKATFSLAVTKSVLGKLNISSLQTLRLAEHTLPWVDERRFTSLPTDEMSVEVAAVITESARVQLRDAIAMVKKAAALRGRGQHKNNAARMATLSPYFSTVPGRRFQELWLSWQSMRLALRQAYCLGAYPQLRKLYEQGREVSVVLGGPPCKGFSRIGRAVIRELREQGAHAWACNKFGDERNALMYHYVIFLEALRPDVFLFENVSNFASTLKTPDGEFDAPQLLEDLIDSLDCDGLHYDIDAKIIRAKDHGIPQARERYIMCGVSSRAPALNSLDALELEQCSTYVTLGEALSGLPTPKIFRETAEGVHELAIVTSPASHGVSPVAAEYFAWLKGRTPSESWEVDGHIYRRPRLDDAKLYKLLAPGIRWMDLKTPAAESLATLSTLIDDFIAAMDGRTELVKRARSVKSILTDSLALRLLLEQASQGLDEPHHLLADGYLSNGSGQHGDWLERLSATKPCKTVVAHIGKDTYGYVHPFEARPITIREAARVQSFPDWFRFGGVGVVDAYSMIGNAVPPLLAAKIAFRIATQLSEGAKSPASRRRKGLVVQHSLDLMT